MIRNLAIDLEKALELEEQLKYCTFMLKTEEAIMLKKITDLLNQKEVAVNIIDLNNFTNKLQDRIKSLHDESMQVDMSYSAGQN